MSASSLITEQNMIRWKAAMGIHSHYRSSIPISVLLFPLPFQFHSHCHSHSRGRESHGIPIVPISMHISSVARAESFRKSWSRVREPNGTFARKCTVFSWRLRVFFHQNIRAKSTTSHYALPEVLAWFKSFDPQRTHLNRSDNVFCRRYYAWTPRRTRPPLAASLHVSTSCASPQRCRRRTSRTGNWSENDVQTASSVDGLIGSAVVRGVSDVLCVDVYMLWSADILKGYTQHSHSQKYATMRSCFFLFVDALSVCLLLLSCLS